MLNMRKLTRQAALEVRSTGQGKLFSYSPLGKAQYVTRGEIVVDGEPRPVGQWHAHQPYAPWSRLMAVQMLEIAANHRRSMTRCPEPPKDKYGFYQPVDRTVSRRWQREACKRVLEAVRLMRAESIGHEPDILAWPKLP